MERNLYFTFAVIRNLPSNLHEAYDRADNERQQANRAAPRKPGYSVEHVMRHAGKARDLALCMIWELDRARRDAGRPLHPAYVVRQLREIRNELIHAQEEAEGVWGYFDNITEILNEQLCRTRHFEQDFHSQYDAATPAGGPRVIIREIEMSVTDSSDKATI